MEKVVGGGKPKPPRQTWSSQTHFQMAVISFAVGLGNIWRFPSLVYEHRGGAFLIPYLICSFAVGFPMLYLELTLGQFARVGPALVYGRVAPLFQGVGWAMVTLTMLVAIYYNMAVAWTLIYIFTIVTGQSHRWASCRNSFNTECAFQLIVACTYAHTNAPTTFSDCSSSLEDERCASKLSNTESNTTMSLATTDVFYFNRSCYLASNVDMQAKRTEAFTALPAVSPAEEFFENYVLERAATIDSLGGLNVKLALAYFVAWAIAAVVLFKGVKLMGRVAYFTATVPYVIIVILFVRSITLDGAYIGLNFYLLKPDFTVLWDLAAWRAAATQVSYSLSVGFGGLLSLSSYNPPDHNCYRDAAVITVADGAMSIIGGTAVFSTLGFIAKQLQLPIDQVVQSGTGLAFIAYPEALSRMPIPWLWSLLFFVMMCTLGVSTQFGFAECICTALADQFHPLRRHRAKLTFITCGILYATGLILCTRTGVYYFNILNDYSASFALAFVLFVESILVLHIYGHRNWRSDLRHMFGAPRSWLGRWFGPTGRYVFGLLRFECPAQAAMIFCFALATQISHNLTYGKAGREYVLPYWCVVLGWLISLIPLIWLPVFALLRWIEYRGAGMTFRDTLRPQAKWPSARRENNSTANSSSTVQAAEYANEAYSGSSSIFNPQPFPLSSSQAIERTRL